MATTDEELTQLERDIRQLKIEYDQYFGGGKKRPPSDVEWRIEQLIKRYADRSAEISFGQRFRYNNLAQTYAKYREIFRKRMKQREEGVPRHFGAAARTIEAARARAGGNTISVRENPLPVCAVACSDPDKELEKVVKLYEAFVAAKQNAGESTERLNLHTFKEFLTQKAQQFTKRDGSQQVEYVVAVEAGKVRLKARVKK